MNDKIKFKGEHKFGHTHGRRGPSSFNMHDSEFVFKEINLKEGDTFLDLGCGAGDYSIKAAKIVGESGMVYSLDIWEKMLDGLKEEALNQGLKNIYTVFSDISKQINIKDKCVDICFIATVIHTIDMIREGKKLFEEIKRVLKSDGKLVVIECKKEDMPFGPPMNMRISSLELEEEINKYGFKKIGYSDLGYNYMVQFEIK